MKAKEENNVAAGIAEVKISQLKDALAEKDDALNLISQENENFRINQAAALENIKQLKRVLSESSSKLPKSEKGKGKKLKPHNSIDEDNEDSIMQNKHIDSHKYNEEESPGDPFRGYIFDTEESVDSTNQSAFTDDVVTINWDDFDRLDDVHFDDMDSNKSSRKKKAFLRRFGDLIRRRSFHIKEP
ncbi:hypothetical protein CFOL_v3_35753 [Cephalotus follicularis]|uniref:Uncharacterized protein n=1 Tax=Cephalotus follicularis TaxID=3775 RepID=A0A1Q3DIQ7_CEPFO|nr:hypothetical protein CFOL_v3_35753 [Cephalotus follicularis]